MHRCADSILRGFGDEYLARPQLDDLLHLAVFRIGDPNPVFDSVRDGVEPLCRPSALLAAPRASVPQHPSDQETIELVVLGSAAPVDMPSVDAPAPRVGDGRMVWLVGDGAFDALTAVHKNWSAHRTVADDAADGDRIRVVCADLVRAVTEGAAPAPIEWVASAAVSRMLRGAGYAVG